MKNQAEQVVSIKALIAEPCRAILNIWKTLPPLAHAPSDAPQDKLFEFLAWLLSEQTVADFRAASSAKDLRALAALGTIAKWLCEACETLLERCKKQKLGGYWRELSNDATIIARLAEACERHGDRALACFLHANALRALGDTSGTVEAYRQSIAAAETAGEMRGLLACAHDNIGNALTDLGFYDEAIGHYRKAFELEVDPAQRQIILANKARLLAALGEWRSAARTYLTQVEQLEARGASGNTLAIALDSAANAIVPLGESATALVMLRRARSLFEPENLQNRAINALVEAEVCLASKNQPGAAAAFKQAHHLAFDVARGAIDPEVYERGFRGALAASLPATDKANQYLLAGIWAKEHDATSEAFRYWQEAVNLARQAGDHKLALRVNANAAALLADLGQVNRAIEIATQVCAEANRRGLALPELMALGTLASMAASGADIHDRMGPLGPLSRTAVLQQVQAGIVAALGLDPEKATFETADTGAVSNELALLAQKYGADDLAAQYFRTAVDRVKNLKTSVQLVNRLAGLRVVLSRNGENEEAGRIAQEIAALLDSSSLPHLGRIVAHRTLAEYWKKSNRRQAITHLRAACDAIDKLRLAIVPGLGRAEFDRQFPDVPYNLAELLRQDGDVSGAFEALQRAKGRRFVEVLAAKYGPSEGDLALPPTLPETQTLLQHLGEQADTVLLDLAVESDGLVAYIVDDNSVRAVAIAGDKEDLAAVERGDVREREMRLVSLCLNAPLLGALAETVCDIVAIGKRALVVPDRLLHNLPLHAIPVHGQPWGDRLPMSYIPAVAALRFATAPQSGSRGLVAGDSRGDLPDAAVECTAVGHTLGVRPLIGQACTRAAIENALRDGHPEIVHLAVHGRGDTRHGMRASLLFADGQGGTEWVSFDSLTEIPWTARLVVVSGCSTGVLGSAHGHNLLSVASAMLEAGAASVLASLWPVNDEHAKLFTIAFYHALSRARTERAPTERAVDLRLVLREAQDSLRNELERLGNQAATHRRDGRGSALEADEESAPPQISREMADALAWSSFALFGRPILT